MKTENITQLMDQGIKAIMLKFLDLFKTCQ